MFTTLTQFCMADKTKTKIVAIPTPRRCHAVIPETKTRWWVLSTQLAFPFPEPETTKTTKKTPPEKQISRIATALLLWAQLLSAPLSSARSQLCSSVSWEGMGSSGRGTETSVLVLATSLRKKGNKIMHLWGRVTFFFPWARTPSDDVDGIE